MAKKVGMLIDLEFCVGCYACQSCCQDYNELPVEETYLRVINTRPDEIDGKMYMYMTPVPYRLDQCAICLEKEGEAPCSKICIAKCLYVDEVSALYKVADTINRRCSVFQG